MSDIQLQSDQFVAGRQDKAAQYQMAGAQALGQGISQAPGDFMRAQAAQQQLAESQAHVALSEAHRAELQQHFQVTSQLMALGQQKEQVRAMKLQNDHADLALQQMRDEMSGKLSSAEYARAVISTHDRYGLPLLVGDNQVMTFDPTTGHYGTRPQTPEEAKKRSQINSGSHADPIKLRQDAIIARMRMLNARMGKRDKFGRPVPADPRDIAEQDRLAHELDALHAAPDTGVTPQQTPEWDAGLDQTQQPDQQQAAAPTQAPAQQPAPAPAQQTGPINWSPRIAPLISSNPGVEGKLQELAKINGMSPQQLADKMASDPQTMRSFLKWLGYTDDGVDRYMRGH